MDKELSSALVDVIKAGKDWVINLALFVQQQAPDLARQIVKWGLWSNLFEVFIELFSIFAVLKSYQWALAKVKEDKYDSDNPLYWIIFIIGGIFAIIMFVCFINSGETFIKCLVSPKLYLIEYVKNLVK